MTEFGEPLSQRELEVLQCVTGGASNKEIAASLTISENTVKVHLRNIFNKLGAASRTEATTIAIQKGLVIISGSEKENLSNQSVSQTIVPSDLDSDEQNIHIPSLQPEPAKEIDPAASETPKPSITRFLSRQTLVLLFILLTSVVLIAYVGFPAISGRFKPTPIPYLETPFGQTGWIETNRPLPNPRANMAIATIGLNVYQIGGETTDGVVNSVNVYNTIEHNWKTAAYKPTAVADITAAVLFGEIYVPGGRLPDGKPTDIVEVYSPANDAWQLATALPQSIAGGLVLTDGSFLYLFGGWNGEQYLDTAYLYDVESNSWRPLPSMPIARAFATGSVVTGQLYVVGGYDGQNELAQCHIFDPSTSQWTMCPDMLLPRAGAGAAVVLNNLYVIGGGLTKENEIGFSEIYDPNSQTWQIFNTPMLSDTPGWSHLAVTNVEVRIITLGGRRGGNLISDNIIYAPQVYKTFIPAAAASGSDN